MNDTDTPTSRPHDPAFAFASVLDAFPIVAFVADADGAVTYVSNGWRRFVGSDSRPLLEQGFRGVVHADDVARVTDGWAARRASGEPYRDVYRLRTGDDSYRWVESRADAMHGADGAVTGWCGTIVDAVDARPSHDGESHSHFVERLMDATDDCIKVLELDGRLVSMSANGRRALGIDDFATVAGRSWLEFWDGDDRLAAEGAVDEARSGRRGRFSGSLTIAGREVWWDNSATPILGASGKPERLLVVSRDVTQAQLERRKLEDAYQRERRIAVMLQEASLPAALPSVDDVYLSAAYRPSSAEATIGGDWYDAVLLEDGRIALTIGDVIGHGLEAAVTMGKVRQAMHAAALVGAGPNLMLDVADRTVRERSEDTYATAMAGIYDAVRHEFVFASAGHPGPVVRHPDGRIEEFMSPGLLLGLRSSGQTHTVRVAAAAGATLVFYTDGLIEATRDIEEGRRRIHAAISDAAVAGASDPATALVDHVLRGEPPSDDVAVLVVEIGPSRRFDDRST